MAFLQIFITLFAINLINCSAKISEQFQTSTQHRVRHKQNKNVIQKWEFELDERVEYPRGDKENLRQISSLWSEYYECSTRLERSVNAAARLPSVTTSAYEDAIARLPCGLCVAPDTIAIKWLYQRPKSTFLQLAADERMVIEDNGNLVIFKVRTEDAGAYKCTIGRSAGGTVLLDVINRREPYRVVKPLTSRGPYPASDQWIQAADLSLLSFTSWAPWSECSVCGRVGRRRRYGMCFVKASRNRSVVRSKNNSTLTERDKLRKANELKVFQDFPAGIPCRSRYLPARIRNVQNVAQRRNEIMIGLCKVACDNDNIFEVRSNTGALLERANNTAGVYSLSQRLPQDPPAPVFETIFAMWGEKLILVCPGASLRDIPYTWRVGTKYLAPRAVDKASGGRVHINARDDIVFTELTYADANLYSCWQRDVLVGTVKLYVWEGYGWWRRWPLVTALVVAGLVLRGVRSMLRHKTLHRRS